MRKSLVIATRGSQLALWQAEHVKSRLLSLDPELAVDLVIIKTKGDIIQDVPLAQVGGKGLFVKEIEEALLDNRADLAVHSIKDVPMELPDGLILGCIPKRETPTDCMLSCKYADLAALPSCWPCAPICALKACAAMWTRACANCAKACTMPLFLHPQA